MSFEASAEYVGASAFRFLDKNVTAEIMKTVYEGVVSGNTMAIDDFRNQAQLAI